MHLASLLECCLESSETLVSTNSVPTKGPFSTSSLLSDRWSHLPSTTSYACLASSALTYRDPGLRLPPTPSANRPLLLTSMLIAPASVTVALASHWVVPSSDAAGRHCFLHRPFECACRTSASFETCPGLMNDS